MRPRVLIYLALLALLPVLGACGGAARTDETVAREESGDKTSAAKLVAQTFGPNATAASGVIDGRISISVTGVRRFVQPVTLTLSGPFSDTGDALPDFYLSMGIERADRAYGAEMTSTGGKSFISLGDTGYAIPRSITSSLERSARRSQNGLSRTLAPFGITPETWVTDPHVRGRARFDGVDVVQVQAGVNAARFFVSAGRFARLLNRLSFSGVAGLPTSIDRDAQAALARSVKSATAVALTGASDHVLRKATITLELVVRTADRRRLGGIKRGRIVAELNVSKPGTPQNVEAPRKLGSYRELQALLGTLADQVRIDIRNGKYP